jgi:hypothetical protein
MAYISLLGRLQGHRILRESGNRTSRELQRRVPLADFLPGVEGVEAALSRHIAQKERVLQDQLVAELNRRGFESLREMVVVPRDRVDVAVPPSGDLQVLTLIEAKIADPVRGVGQVLSYRVGAGEPTHCVLVIGWDVFNSQVARACTAAEIELWVMRKGEFKYITGPPTLWNASRGPDEPVYEYKPFEPGPVETCPCCEGAGKIREDAFVEKLGGARLFDDGLRKPGEFRQGHSTGVLKKDL